MSQPTTTPYNPEHRGGSRGWRRHIRRWKSAFNRAESGNKAARTWLAMHGKPVPDHPHQRPVIQKQRASLVSWFSLLQGDHVNRCPYCRHWVYRKEIRDTDRGRKYVLVCESCQSMYRGAWDS